MVALAFLWISTAQAHIASNGFLKAQVSGDTLIGSMELSARDVELAIGVDANHDGKITWGELRASQPQFLQYVSQHLYFATQNSICALSFQSLQVNERVDGIYAWLPFTARCPTAVRQLSVHYSLMDDVDPSHRGLLSLTAGTIVQTGVLGGKAAVSEFAVDHPARWRTFTEYLQAGIGHIWSGIDHLLFLSVVVVASRAYTPKRPLATGVQSTASSLQYPQGGNCFYDRALHHPVARGI